MNSLSWNCRGIGNLQTIQDLCLMIKEKGPKVVFLMKTKLLAKKMERIKRRVKYDECFVVELVGRSGGLAMMWEGELDLEITNYS